MIRAENIVGARGKVLLTQNARTNGIVDVMVHIRNAVGEGHDAPLERFRLHGACVADDAVAHFGRQIQTAPAVLDNLDHTKRLLVVTIKVENLLGGRVNAPHAREA